MNKVDIVELLATEPQGQSVTVQGWARSRRDSKAGLSFIALYDGTCFDALQVIAEQSLSNYQSDVLRISAGFAIEVTGSLVASEGKGQSAEIHATHVTIIGDVDDPEQYPIAKKRHTFEYLRQVAHLRPRTNAFGAISRVRSTLSSAIHQYFKSRRFHWVNTPLITTSDCEGAGELFRVSTLDALNPPVNAAGKVDFDKDFFAREAYLTVSGQLNAESYALALSKVYTFGPTFRAENSNTSRHLAEFWMVEPEMAFANLDDNAQLAEDFLRYLFKAVLDEREDDMAFFAQRIDKDALNRLQHVADASFERMDYSDAIVLLEKSGKKFEYPVSWGLDLQSEHERWLAEEHVGRPVILQNYPKEIKAFYMRENDDGKTVAAMDVLAPGIGEIIGGSQREERLSVLDDKLEALGLSEELDWYRDLRRYGSAPHAGFGMGFERVLNYVTGMEHTRRHTIPACAAQCAFLDKLMRSFPPERIVCLTEETVETLYLLGQQDRIVGVSGFAVRPKGVRREKPRISAFTSADIPKIMALKPDVVLTFSDLQADIVASLLREGLTVIGYNQRDLAGIMAMIRQLGALVGCMEQADALAASYESRLADIRSSVAGRPQPVVYFEEWDGPLISGIHWVSELIEVAGGTDAFPELAHEPKAKDRIITSEQVIAAQPDVIIASWCGKKVRPEKIAARPGWNEIPAVRNGRIVEIKSPLILQPGPAALTDGLDEIIAALAMLN